MNDYNRGALPDPCLRLYYGFGEQWASVELGDGTGYVRLADYEKAVTENAKLREQVTRLQAELGIPPHDYESRMRVLETGDRDWCPMQLSGLARCEGPDPVLKAENEKLRDYVYALTECKEKACLCEYCPHGRNDFDDDNAFIHCDFDFEQLKQDAGIE